jgi:hypothetical protein
MTHPRKPASARFLASCSSLFFLATLLLCYPGSLGWDATVQWYDARTGHIVSHHPAFMAFIWHWLDLAVPGPGLFLALQLAFFWGAVHLLLTELRPTRIVAVVSCILLGFNPYEIAQSALVIKDVMGGNVALLALVVLLRYPRTAHRLRLVLLVFALLALAGLFRFQFWLLAIPGFATIYLFEHTAGAAARAPHMRHVAAAAVAALLVPVLMAQATMHATLDVRSSTDRNFRQVMLFDIGAAIAEYPNLDLHLLAKDGLDVATLRSAAKADYLPYPMIDWTETGIYDRITDQIGDALGEPAALGSFSSKQLTMAQYVAQWKQMLFAVPGPFLETRLLSVVRLLGIGGSVEACWPLTTVGFLRQPADLWQALHGADLKEAYVTHLLRSRYFPAATFVFRPATYLVLSLGLCIAWFSSRRRPDVFVYGLVIAAWFYILTFLPFNPDCEVRYSYFACTMILFALVHWGTSVLALRAKSFATAQPAAVARENVGSV